MWMTCLALAGKCVAFGARGFFDGEPGLPASAVTGPSNPASWSKPTRPTMPRPVPAWQRACRRVIMLARFRFMAWTSDVGFQIPDQSTRWQMADGEWQMADGEWQMADGRWRMADEH